MYESSGFGICLLWYIVNGCSVTLLITCHEFRFSHDELIYILNLYTGELKMQISTTTGPKTVRLSVAQPQGNANTAKQGYDLTVDPASQVIRIVGRGSAGLFYGVQSLISLIATYPNGLPQVTITDEPRFEYRGMHVDVARNFHSISDLKRLMDAMAMYKMNMLHLHLSDDEGWRLQIPDLPELTSVGILLGLFKIYRMVLNPYGDHHNKSRLLLSSFEMF